MSFENGTILTGKVTGITKFGAFVSLAPGKSGLVYISEIANTFVKDIHDYLTIGQEVKVKILSTDENGRINLSIKAAAEEPEKKQTAAPIRKSFPQKAIDSRQDSVSTPAGEVLTKSGNAAFEEKLEKFLQDSNKKISGIPQYADSKKSRKGRR